MKKLLAVLLAVAMLVPMGLSVAAQAEEIEKDPFRVLSWSKMDQEKYPYLKQFSWLGWSSRGQDAHLSGAGGSLTHGSYTDADVTKMATAIKTNMEARPAGMRYLYFHGPDKLYSLCPEDAVFMEFVVEQMTAITDALMKKLKEIDCPLDGALIDTEYIGMQVYYMIDTDSKFENLVKNPMLLRQIVNNPKYKTRLRPMLEEYGFKFYDAGSPAKQETFTELFSLTKGAGSEYEISRNIWNVVIRNHLNQYNNEWLYEPLKKYYPDAHCSDYQSMDTDSWLRMATVNDDGTAMTGGNSIKVGNTSTNSFYYTRPSVADIKNYTKVTGFNEPYYVAEPFTGLLYDVNFARYMYLSSDTKRISPWTSSYNYVYSGDKRVSVAKTPYYTDLIYHLGMFNPQPFLHYNILEEVGTKEDWDNISHILNSIISSLNDVAGYADRKPIEMPINWNSKFVLTGMYTGGRNLWRITPNNNIVSREDFLVSEKVPTFYVNGQTVTFPGGKLLEETPIKDVAGNEIGSVGYWVETAADVNPVITADKGRYEAFPSLAYDFEDYKLGVFDYNTSQPANGWGFTWKKTADGVKGASTIVTVDGNKMLSIIGNSKNWLKSLPAKITAGDSFAESQAWQITVTIPDNLSKDAQITLLNYAGSEQEIADGGFMVKDGKLYYASNINDDAGQPVYQEMMDVDTDTPYTLKRLVDFNNKDAFTCTYVVQNKNGKTLKTVENVPVPTFEIIETIGFGVAEANEAVDVDDFKIYLTGTTTDFYVYDAKTGRNAELDVQRDSATAYRLSWLNATTKTGTAYIKADITENGKTTTTVVKEVTMRPGFDSVETGVVDVREGQTVKVYLESAFEDKGESGGNVIWIAVIAVVVLAAAGVATWLCLKKKKTAVPAAEEKIEDLEDLEDLEESEAWEETEE